VEAVYEPRQDRAKGRLTKKAAKIPTASEAEERAYWEREDSTADLDWRRAKRVRLPNLQPSTTAISLRLPVSLLEEIKIAAHKRDVPYQSLIKMWLSEKVG
jgi:predicted DNA binding CopG/RHH family protein